jgi:hypothetical protein
MRFTLSALLAGVFLVSAADPFDQSGVPLEVDTTDRSLKKIVLLAGSKSSKPGGHEYFAGCALLMDWLKQTPGVFPVMARDGWPTNEGIFKNASAVVFYMDGGTKTSFLEKRRWQIIRDLEKQGVGFVLLHQMVDLPKDRHDETLRWAGATWNGTVGGRGHWSSKFEKFPDHPVGRGLKQFELINDGWLYGWNWSPNPERVIPILVTHPPDSSRKGAESLKRSGQEEIMAWTYERPNGGRTFAFSGADWHANWAVEGVRRAVINGTLWSAGIEIPKQGAPVRLAPGSLLINLDDKGKANSNPNAARNPRVKYIQPASLTGIVLDDLQGKIKGSWKGSSATGPEILGRNYLHDGGSKKGKGSITFSPRLPTAGRYEIVLFAPPLKNRSPNARVTVSVAGKAIKTLAVNQQRLETKGRHILGEFELPTGNVTTVEISNEGTTGVVVVDGIQFRPLD